MVTSMDNLDQMFTEAKNAPDVAAELADLEEGEVQLKPTAVEISKESQPTTIWHRATGEPRVMPRLYARWALTKRFRRTEGDAIAGELVFSSKPILGRPWVLGTVKCWLHPDQPERPFYDTLGLPRCYSAHFPSTFEATIHMKSDHPSADDRLKEMKEEKEKTEDRALARETQETNAKLLKQFMKQNKQPRKSKVTT